MLVGTRKVKKAYGDGAPEFIRAMKSLNITYDRSTTGKPQTNGVIENMNKDVIHGTRSILVQARFPSTFGHMTVKHYCHAHNITVQKG